jgi:hypothetical protein
MGAAVLGATDFATFSRVVEQAWFDGFGCRGVGSHQRNELCGREHTRIALEWET